MHQVSSHSYIPLNLLSGQLPTIERQADNPYDKKQDIAFRMRLRITMSSNTQGVIKRKYSNSKEEKHVI